MLKAFNDLSDFSTDEILDLLSLAESLQVRPEPNALAGRVLALLFLSPSLRTLASFQAAMARLGGNSFVISPDMSIHGLAVHSGIAMDGEAAEHIREAVPVIASYADAIGIRARPNGRSGGADLSDTEFKSLIDLVDVPYINMESAISHPCQGLGDWKTLDDLEAPRAGGKFVLSWVFHPQAQPISVPSSVLHMAAYRGMDVTVLCPEEFELPDFVMEKAKQAAAISGGSVRQTSDRKEGLEGAHVLYARSWSSQAQSPGEDIGRSQMAHWRVGESWFQNAAENCQFMHCMPVRRGVEVDDEVLDGPRSAIIRQAQNRMFVQAAILHRMLS